MPLAADLSGSPQSIPPPESLRARLAAFAADIKIGHTIFALPFALLSTFLAAKTAFGAAPRAGVLALIVVCMIAARTVAMAANRLLDAELDARNPRTAGRAIPSGRLSRAFVRTILAGCCALFIGATLLFWFIYHNPWPARLALPVLLYLCAYPLLKRFTRLCHYYLGIALALAPICAWVAVAARLDWPPLIMAGAVALWTAGFDIIYACQDYRSDQETGVRSIPARIGIGPALWISRVTHAGSAAMLILLGFSTPLFGPLYFSGVGCAIALLIVEHAMVRPDDLSKVRVAFFTINGIISIVLGTLGIIDVFI
jgi:4-hydroxybenzoate polyprenyltransferase